MDLGIVLGRLAIIVLGMGAVTAHAGISWDEAGSGDLSGDGLSPTPLVLSVGSNHVLGTTGNSGSGVDRDYFRIAVPTGTTLSSIVLLPNTNVSGGSSFFAVQRGPQLTVPTSGSGAAQLLIGYGHYGNSEVGSDLLPMLLGASSLSSDTYSVWVQETGGPATYGLDFIITSTGGPSASVPTLPEWGMILLGMLLAGIYWRRSASRRAV